MSKSQKIPHSNSDSTIEYIESREDEYFNAVQFAKAYEANTDIHKDVRNWLADSDTGNARDSIPAVQTKLYIATLSWVTGLPFERLVEVKEENGNYEMWLHPMLLVFFAMWVSDDYSLQYEEWAQKGIV